MFIKRTTVLAFDDSLSVVLCSFIMGARLHEQVGMAVSDAFCFQDFINTPYRLIETVLKKFLSTTPVFDPDNS